MLKLITLAVLSIQISISVTTYPYPEQVHIAFGDSTNQIVVTWSTFSNPFSDNTVDYAKVDEHQSPISAWMTQPAGSIFLEHSEYIHKAVLSNLDYNGRYAYRCCTDGYCSENFWFTVPARNDQWLPARFAVYGDMGNLNARSLPRIIEDTKQGMYDAILHIGDFAYNLDWDNGRVGDEFMRQIEPVAAAVPYMTCPGNHEAYKNFTHYKRRFNMPGISEGKMYYSIDLGLMHLISLNTEAYYLNPESVAIQLNWLRDDLKKANQNRLYQPWIVVMGHRPMYCSATDGFADCSEIMSKVRESLEDLLYEAGVDLEFWGHVHGYERSWPTYNYQVLNGSYEMPYVNPRAPVHIITGNAGCDEIHSWLANCPLDCPKDWSAFRSTEYGYSRMTVYNRSHLLFQQVSDDQQGKVIDDIWIVKDRHGPYPPIPVS